MDSLGKSGSLEAYANARRGRATAPSRRSAASETSSLATAHRAGEAITPRMIAEEAERGDELARRVIMETAYWLAIGIVSFVHTIDPDAVVLGGAMTFGGPASPLGREFLQRIRDEVRPRLLEPLRDTVQIEFASLGGDAGYIGAAGLARLEHRKQRWRSIRRAQVGRPHGTRRRALSVLSRHEAEGDQLPARRAAAARGQLAECHGAGTGCGWCRPFLKKLFDAAQTRDAAAPDLPTPDEYAHGRSDYVRAGKGTPPPGATPIDPT